MTKALPLMDFWCNRCGSFAGRAIILTILTKNVSAVLRRHEQKTGCTSLTFHGHRNEGPKNNYTLTLTMKRRKEKKP